MTDIPNLEVWQRGPIDGVPDLLQPVAHALLQAVEDVEKEMKDFPVTLLWEKPAGVASVGFHLKHIRGVVDRLFTYAKGEMLNEKQMHSLRQESTTENNSIENMVEVFRIQVADAINQLKNTQNEFYRVTFDFVQEYNNNK